MSPVPALSVLDKESQGACEEVVTDKVTGITRVIDVINDPTLREAGRLLFPAEDWYWSGDTLGSLSYTWYMRPDAQTTVDVVNRLRAYLLPWRANRVRGPRPCNCLHLPA